MSLAWLLAAHRHCHERVAPVLVPSKERLAASGAAEADRLALVLDGASGRDNGFLADRAVRVDRLVVC
jgi:hypothetical protein